MGDSEEQCSPTYVGEGLRLWQQTHDTSTQVEITVVTVESPYADHEQPAVTVKLHELPTVRLGELLRLHAAARAGTPLTGTPDCCDQLLHAAARVGHLLQDQSGGWASGPPDMGLTAAALTELARACAAATEVVEEVQAIVGAEVAGGGVIGSDPGRSEAEEAEAFRSDSDEAARQLEQTRVLLDGLAARAAGLRRTMAVALAESRDGDTLMGEWVVEARLVGTGPARTHVRLYRPPGGKPVVLLSDLNDNHSTNVMNGVEALARTVAQHLLDGAAHDEVTWVQYDTAELYSHGNRYGRSKEDYQGLTREDRRQVVTFSAGPDFSGPGWSGISHERLEELAGGPVRRWHTHGHTSTALRAAGVPVAALPAADRVRVRPGGPTSSRSDAPDGIALRCRRVLCRARFTTPATDLAAARCPRCDADHPQLR